LIPFIENAAYRHSLKEIAPAYCTCRSWIRSAPPTE
jgi:hypothetical protein